MAAVVVRGSEEEEEEKKEKEKEKEKEKRMIYFLGYFYMYVGFFERMGK